MVEQNLEQSLIQASDPIRGKLLHVAKAEPSNKSIEFFRSLKPYLFFIFVIVYALLTCGFIFTAFVVATDMFSRVLFFLTPFIGLLIIALYLKAKRNDQSMMIEAAIYCYEYELHYYKQGILVFRQPWSELYLARNRLTYSAMLVSEEDGNEVDLSLFNMQDIKRIENMLDHCQEDYEPVTEHFEEEGAVKVLSPNGTLRMAWRVLFVFLPIFTIAIALLQESIWAWRPSLFETFHHIPSVIALSVFLYIILEIIISNRGDRKLYFYEAGVYWYKNETRVDKHWQDLKTVKYHWLFNSFALKFYSGERYVAYFIHPEVARTVQDTWHQILEEKRGV